MDDCLYTFQSYARLFLVRTIQQTCSDQGLVSMAAKKNYEEFLLGLHFNLKLLKWVCSIQNVPNAAYKYLSSQSREDLPMLQPVIKWLIKSQFPEDSSMKGKAVNLPQNARMKLFCPQPKQLPGASTS